MLRILALLNSVAEAVIRLKQSVANCTVEEVLWTNPNPSSSMAAKNLTLNLKKYSHIRSEAKAWNASDMMYSSTIPNEVGKSIEHVYVGTAADKKYYRKIEITSTGLKINNGMAGTTVDNVELIPYKIYGIRKLGGVILNIISSIIHPKVGWMEC